MLTTKLTFSLIGLFFIGLSIPLLRRRVGPNGWYGLRVPATLQDEEIWYEANAKTGRDMLLLGVLQLILALGLPLAADLPPETYAEVNVGVVSVGALLAALLGWFRANDMRAERQRNRSN